VNFRIKYREFIILGNLIFKVLSKKHRFFILEKQTDFYKQSGIIFLL